MRKNKVLALVLTAVMTLGLVSCGSEAAPAAETKTEEAAPATTEAEAPAATEEPAAEAEPDTITIMVPPVTADYADMLATWIADFNKDYPNITVEVIPTSWDEHTEKLSTMAQAGEAPDIAEVSYSAIGTYVDMGVAVNVADYIDLSDYDQNALDYMTLDNIVYGLPLYLTIQALGGNKELMEAAGIDVEAVQKNGWKYEDFMKYIEKGTTKDCFGFVFANSGVTTADFVSIFGVGAGITSNFTKDLKYAYTSENMLNLLKAVEEMTKSGYMPNYAVEAGQRLVMLECGQTMITGKAMPLFEGSVNKNNAGIADGTAAEGSVEVQYVFLPVPTMDNVQESCFGSVDGMIALKNSNSDDAHLKNVCTFLDYICSGDRVAATDNQLYLSCVCKSGREAQAGATLDQTEGNAAATERCISLVQAPPTGITAEQAANAKTIMDEVIVPKFQALIAGETTAEDMFEAVKSEAFDLLGEDNCETGFIK